MPRETFDVDLPDDVGTTGAPRVIRLAGARRTSALGLAMLGLEEAIYGPNEAEVVVVGDDAGAPPDGNVKVTLGDKPSESKIVVRANKGKH